MTLERATHLILDRDGVLNEEAPQGGYVRSPAEWRWIPGALEALAMLARAGVRVSVATNQSGVGRGVMTNADLASVHQSMLADVKGAGGSVAAVFTCPHAPWEGCRCRKPATGLIEDAVTASGIGADEAVVVGDDLRDLEAAQAAGVAAVLVLTGKGRSAAGKLHGNPVPVYDDLLAVAQKLVGAPHRKGESRS